MKFPNHKGKFLEEHTLHMYGCENLWQKSLKLREALTYMHMYFLLPDFSAKSLHNVFPSNPNTGSSIWSTINNLILHWPPRLLLLRVHHFYHIIILHVSLLGSFQSFSALLSYSCPCINFQPLFLPVPTAIYYLGRVYSRTRPSGISAIWLKMPHKILRCHIKWGTKKLTQG